MKALIIDEPWISLIISGQETWEMRSRNTSVRGHIGLIQKGAKTVIGVADLVETLPKLTKSELLVVQIIHLESGDALAHLILTLNDDQICDRVIQPKPNYLLIISRFIPSFSGIS